jgi:protein SCO1/2
MKKSCLFFRAAALRVSLLSSVIFTALAGAQSNEKLVRSTDHDYDAPAPGTYQLPIIRPAADGALVDAGGKTVSLRELTHGRVTVLSFIYTRCASAKACPMATGVLMDLHEMSADHADLAKNLRLVSMSFDPEHDTPDRMRAYSALASQRPDAAPWHFVTARSEAELRPVLAAYGQAVDRKANPADPTGPLNHTLRVYLIDRAGRIRNIYSSGTLDLRLVLADVRTLLLEKPRNLDS